MPTGTQKHEVANHRESKDKDGKSVTTPQLTNAFYVQFPKLQSNHVFPEPMRDPFLLRHRWQID
jgi:hypothetical protein